MQRLLAAPVAALDARLRRVGAAVILEVELAAHRRVRAGLGLERLEELGRGMGLRARKPLQVAGAAEGLEHRRRGAAAAVAVAEHEQAGPGVIVVPVVADGAPQLADRGLGDVGLRGREVRQHLAAVGPCQVNVWSSGCVKRFQKSFCVKKREMPAPRMICGSCAL